MNDSKQEEIIGTSWIIAAILAFGFGYSYWGYAFAIKGGLDQIMSISIAIKRRIASRGSDKRKA